MQLNSYLIPHQINNHIIIVYDSAVLSSEIINCMCQKNAYHHYGLLSINCLPKHGDKGTVVDNFIIKIYFAWLVGLLEHQ